MKSNKETKKEKGFFKKLFDNVTENVKEGASLVGDKVSEVGEIVAEKSAKVFVSGTELVSETSDKIHDYTEKQALQKEEKFLKERQSELKFQFGDVTLEHFLKNDSLHKAFLTTKAVTNVVKEYQANEKRIKTIVKAIKKLETHK